MDFKYKVVSLRVILVLTLTIVLIIPIHYSEAATPRKYIGIIIEKTCLISPDCLKYSDIVDMDSSIAKYSGGFVKSNGDIKRDKPPYKNSMELYKADPNSSFRIFVDPPAVQNGIPTIFIVSSLDEYHLPGQLKVTNIKTYKDGAETDKVRTFSHTRYADNGCSKIVITAKDWKVVLPDTIEYVRSGCDAAHTNLKTISDEKYPLFKHDIKTSYKWKDQKWRDQIIKECTKSRNACTDLKQPTRAGL